MPYDSHANITEYTNIKDMESTCHIKKIFGAKCKTPFFLTKEHKKPEET